MSQGEEHRIQAPTTTTNASPISPKTPSFFPATGPEPSSPRPSVTLPSATLPTTFPPRPTYTIGTKSHAYSADNRKSVPASRVPASPSLTSASMPETDESPLKAALPTSASIPVSPPTSPSTGTSIHRASSLQRLKSPASPSIESAAGPGSETSVPPAEGTAVAGTLSRKSSLSLNLSRHSSLSKKHGNNDREQAVPASPSSTHRPQKHFMLNRRSVSQDFQIRLQQQQQQRQEDMGGEDVSEVGEDLMPGTPTSISSLGSSTMGIGVSDKERDKSLSGRSNRLSRSSVSLIESRSIQTLSSNLAMVSSPTDSESPQQNSDSLLSVIAQKEARIAQLREDLETNLAELTQLKERWSQMMIEERNRQQAEASASIQEQERQLYGHSSSLSVSHRLSTTGAGIWGTVVGSVSGISGVSGGISLHNINALHQQQQYQSPHSTMGSPNGIVSGRSSTSSNPTKGESRPTSPLPAYLSNYSTLNGLSSPVSPVGQNGSLGSASIKKGDRTSMSSLSTCSSSQSNAGDGPIAFEAGHSSQSSFSSAGHPDPSSLQMQLHKEHRDSRKMKRESSGLFIPSEAEEVLVNTGRALFKGFGSLLGGIRTVVTDVAEFQHSRQRTIDMVSGLAQTAADALPLPSHDDIYYHHQRLRLLDEEEEEALSVEEQQQRHQQQQQQAKERRRRERQKEREKEKERRLQEGEQGGSSSDPAGVARSPSLKRRTSRKTDLEMNSNQNKADNLTTEQQETEKDSLSRSISQSSIQEGPKSKLGSTIAAGLAQDEEEALEWDIEDRELLESLEADVREQEKGSAEMIKTVPELRSAVDTPVRSGLGPSTAFALSSKKND
ncbi:hypothetical protein BGZ54_002549 [Gamsiella multidivaricata]|nr:hypothetical protein BGZ54_002549 [Gamsiella multidivaricata]